MPSECGVGCRDMVQYVEAHSYVLNEHQSCFRATCVAII